MPSTRSTKARSPVVKIEPLDASVVQETSSQSPMMFVPAVKKENEYFHEHREDDEELLEEDIDDADNDEDYDDEDGNVDDKKNKISKKIDHGIDIDGSAKSKAELSELEKRRLENIKRNEEYLKSMGFDSLQSFERKKTEESETKKKRAPRLKRNISDAGEDVEGGSSNLMEPVRRSRRLSKQPGEIEGEDNNDSQFIDLDGVVPSSSARKAAREQYILEIDPDADIGREKITAPMLHNYIESKQPEHLGLISNEMITHTAYRMSYMSNDKLATRLKAIARAAGKSSHEKLLVFYYALKVAKLENLAEAAKVALSRLGEVLE